MVTADRIPGLENFLNSTPKQIGVAVALYAKRARKERFHPANSIDAVGTGSGLTQVSYEFQRVRFEGVA
jgi:beta-phosphoglucomutase-like phosphatase (HAD superfamily)